MKKGINSFRVFVDTNVCISAIHSKDSLSRKLLLTLSEDHRLCSYTISEITRVIEKHYSHKAEEWDFLLSRLEFELVYTPSNPSSIQSSAIRDPKDLPILVSAILAKSDILVTGDKDFFTNEIKDHLVVYTPAGFEGVERYS